MDIEEAAKLVKMAITVFPNMANMDDDKKYNLVMGWCITLGDMSYSLAGAALVKVLQTSKFWPTAAEIRDAAKSIVISQKQIQGSPDVDSAWIEVCKNLDPYKAPIWSHSLIQKAVQFMGYANLCHSTNITSDRIQFTRIYEQLLNREKENASNAALMNLLQNKEELLLKIGTIGKKVSA